jgi:hypothetical protein
MGEGGVWVLVCDEPGSCVCGIEDFVCELQVPNRSPSLALTVGNPRQLQVYIPRLAFLDRSRLILSFFPFLQGAPCKKTCGFVA